MVAIQLHSGDYFIDTDEKTSLGLHFVGGVVEVITHSVTYTYNLSVPATANNNNLFAYSKNGESDGVRTGTPASIIVSGANISGYLYVIRYTGGRYELFFKEGEDMPYLGVKINTLPLENESIYIREKSEILAGDIPKFGFYKYINPQQTDTIEGGGLNLFPVVNYGELLLNIFAVLGISYNTGGVWDDPLTNPHNYGLILSKNGANKHSKYNVVGSGINGWSVSDENGEEVEWEEVGWLVGGVRYKRGYFNANITFNAFRVERSMRVKIPPGVVVVMGDGRDIVTPQKEMLEKYADSTEWGYYFNGLDKEFAAGEWFGVVSPNDWRQGIFKGYWDGSVGYTTEVDFEVEIIEEEGVAQAGQELQMADLLPDVTIAELLEAYAKFIGGWWKYDDYGIMEIVQYTSQILDKAVKGGNILNIDEMPLVEVSRVERFIDGLAQHNLLTCKSADYVTEDKRFVRDYAIYNEYLNDVADFYTIPFNDGNYEVINGEKLLSVEDVTTSEGGGKQYKGNVTFFRAGANGALHISSADDEGLGVEFKSLIRQATTATIVVKMPLYMFRTLTPTTIASWRGRYYIISSATWNDDKAEIEMLRVPTAAELQV